MTAATTTVIVDIKKRGRPAGALNVPKHDEFGNVIPLKRDIASNVPKGPRGRPAGSKNLVKAEATQPAEQIDTTKPTMFGDVSLPTGQSNGF